MRKFSLLAVVLTLSLFLFACGGGQDDSEGGSSSDGDTIVIGIASDWKTMDPARAYEVYANLYFYATYENLYMVEGSEFTPEPALATDHSIDDSGLEYTFTLDEGRKFSSGNDVTADDVVFSINRTMNIKDNASALTENVEKVEAVDDHEVVITLKEKDSSFLSKITSNAFAIVDSEVVEEMGGTDAEDAASTDEATATLDSESAGSGPYVLKKWTENTEMVLEENPHYDGTVEASQVIIKEMPDPNTQVQALENGEIDVALSVGPDQVDSIDSSDNVEVVSSPTSTMTFLLMNDSEEIGEEMSDPLVQQAVRYALDYEGFQSLAGEGALLPLSFVQDGFSGAQSRAEDYQDIDKAKELMEEAGYEDGFTVPLTVANFDSEGLSWTTIGEKVKEDLAEINIDVEIETGEIGVVIEDYRGGNNPFLLMHWSPDYFDVVNQLAFVPDNIVGTRANWEANGHDELLDLAEQIQEETDESKRAEMSEEMQELMAEDSPYGFLIQHPITFAVSKDLEGVTYNDLFKLPLNELKLSN